jgi:hypothetical protein
MVVIGESGKLMFTSYPFPEIYLGLTGFTQYFQISHQHNIHVKQPILQIVCLVISVHIQL